MATRTQSNEQQNTHKNDCYLYQEYKKFFIYFHYTSLLYGGLYQFSRFSSFALISFILS